ncbi:hypothetical protein [Myxococcus virescens]|uniref:hypothetical protein n=1 Tax=Myxococcus virescens TaxID=83456 RepID=UPI0014289F4A|nr:hypothetical protein [Myxococcus virescens]
MVFLSTVFFTGPPVTPERWGRTLALEPLELRLVPGCWTGPGLPGWFCVRGHVP